jgi:spermidine synthase
MKFVPWCVALLSVGLLLAAPGTTSSADTKVLLEKESLYHYIRVTQTGAIRRMQFRRAGDEFEESAIDVNAPLQFPLQYYRLMLAGFAHQPAPRTVLFVGMGGGTLPMAIHHYFPQSQIDNVELDPEVVAVAKRFFGFQEDARMKVFIRDGRRQVRQFRQEKKKYDVIFLDAFRGGYIPYHLTTREFLEEIKALLTPAGVVVSNLHPGFESYHYQRRTYAAVFKSEAAYGWGGNLILVTDMREKPAAAAELLATAERLQREKQFTSDLPTIIKEGVGWADYDRKGPILTDDYAPTDVLRGIPRE